MLSLHPPLSPAMRAIVYTRSPIRPPIQGILHWDVGESTQLVAPMAIGLLLFDMVYMVALLFKLKML